MSVMHLIVLCIVKDQKQRENERLDKNEKMCFTGTGKKITFQNEFSCNTEAASSLGNKILTAKISLNTKMAKKMEPN